MLPNRTSTIAHTYPFQEQSLCQPLAVTPPPRSRALCLIYSPPWPNWANKLIVWNNVSSPWKLLSLLPKPPLLHLPLLPPPSPVELNLWRKKRSRPLLLPLPGCRSLSLSIQPPYPKLSKRKRLLPCLLQMTRQAMSLDVPAQALNRSMTFQVPKSQSLPLLQLVSASSLSGAPTVRLVMPLPPLARGWLIATSALPRLLRRSRLLPLAILLLPPLLLPPLLSFPPLLPRCWPLLQLRDPNPPVGHHLIHPPLWLHPHCHHFLLPLMPVPFMHPHGQGGYRQRPWVAGSPSCCFTSTWKLSHGQTLSWLWMNVILNPSRCQILKRGWCQGTSTWYSTSVLLSRSYLITCPRLPFHPGLSLCDPILVPLCSKMFYWIVCNINSRHCHR